MNWGTTVRQDTVIKSKRQQMTLLKDMGLNTYRLDLTNASQFKSLKQLIVEAKKKGIRIVPVLSLDCDLVSDTEEELYVRAYNFARLTVNTFKADIHIWEMGNELEQWAMARPGEQLDDGSTWSIYWGDAGGDSYNDYIADRYNKVRGVIRGLCDGAHQADPKVQCIVNTAGWFHYAFLQRLTSDGVVFEITGYHWYSHYGDIENAYPDENGVGTNIAASLACMGKPIWITECGVYMGTADGDEAAHAKTLSDLIKNFTRIAPIYNIKSVSIYELFDEPYFIDPELSNFENFEAFMGIFHAVLDADGVTYNLGTPKPAYYAIKQLLNP